MSKPKKESPYSDFFNWDNPYLYYAIAVLLFFVLMPLMNLYDFSRCKEMVENAYECIELLK